eukprot:SAG31_NODE_6597_length_1957_cov_1.491927_3_plen_106_part_01
MVFDSVICMSRMLFDGDCPLESLLQPCNPGVGCTVWGPGRSSLPSPANFLAAPPAPTICLAAHDKSAAIGENVVGSSDQLAERWRLTAEEYLEQAEEVIHSPVGAT